MKMWHTSKIFLGSCRSLHVELNNAYHSNQQLGDSPWLGLPLHKSSRLSMSFMWLQSICPIWHPSRDSRDWQFTPHPNYPTSSPHPKLSKISLPVWVGLSRSEALTWLPLIPLGRLRSSQLPVESESLCNSTKIQEIQEIEEEGLMTWWAQPGPKKPPYTIYDGLLRQSNHKP